MARRFDEIEAQLANPTGTFDQSRYTALVKERAQLEAPVQTFRRLAAALAESGKGAQGRELAHQGAVADPVAPPPAEEGAQVDGLQRGDV